MKSFSDRPRGLRAAVALLALLVLSVSVAPTLAAETAEPVAEVAEPDAPPGESFRYTWKLSKFLGWIAGLFLPNRGEGSLTFEPVGADQLRGELLITSRDSESGEYWSYTALMDRATGRTLRAGSSYFYDGKQKDRSSKVESEGVFDIASAIHLLRQDPPRRPRRIEVWSDGKVYPVVVQPRGTGQRKVGERKIAARQFTIAPAPGAERKWKGKLELWIANDEQATPVEIVVHRSGLAVRLRLAA